MGNEFNQNLKILINFYFRIENICNTSSLQTNNNLICSRFWTGLQQRDRIWIPPHTDYMIGSVFKVNIFFNKIYLKFV